MTGTGSRRCHALTGLLGPFLRPYAETAATLGCPSSEAVEAELPFNDLNAGSLTAVELRKRLSARSWTYSTS